MLKKASQVKFDVHYLFMFKSKKIKYYLYSVILIFFKCHFLYYLISCIFNLKITVMNYPLISKCHVHSIQKYLS